MKYPCYYLGGFHLHLLGFPFVYRFELQIELEPNLLVQNPIELIISPTFQIFLISCVTKKKNAPFAPISFEVHQMATELISSLAS